MSEIEKLKKHIESLELTNEEKTELVGWLLGSALKSAFIEGFSLDE